MAVQAQRAVPPTFLRRVVQSDGLLCVIAGIVLSLANNLLAVVLGIPAAGLFVLGIVLLVYGSLVVYRAMREPFDRQLAVLVMVGNGLWVLASIAILATGWLPLTPVGWWSVAVLALIVAGFAELQFIGLRK